MKCTLIQITLFADDAREAAVARLLNEDDLGITTDAEVEAYQGPIFIEDSVNCIDLRLVYREGIAWVNFVDATGVRVNYDYPVHSFKRCKHKASDSPVLNH